MDFKEDFEFKPLSEGLGFHPRKEKKSAPHTEELISDFEATPPKRTGVYFLDLETDTMTESADTNKTPMKKSFSEAPPIKDLPTINLTPPPPSQAQVPKTAGAQKINPDPKKTVDQILHSMKNKNQALENKLDLKVKSTLQAPPARIQNQTTSNQNVKTVQPYGFQTIKPTLVKTEMSFTAAFLDGLLIVAACLLCLIVLLSITQLDLISILTQSGQREIYFSTFLLFSVVSLIYLTATRVFMGSTPGEWAFDQQVGTDNEQLSTEYIFKIIYRSFLVIVTGFIVFPIASFAMAKDILGDITGLPLYERK